MLENSLRLKDRVIHYDGDSSVHNLQYLYDKLLSGKSIDDIFVENITQEVKDYNRLSGTNHPLSIKESVKPIESNWNIPQSYIELDLKKYILLALENEIENNNFDDIKVQSRLDRVELELELWKKHDKNMLLATLIYIVNTMEDNNLVWGTGRGSSCSCYTLYLIGLHDVDSVHYNLDIKEFFKDS